MIYQIIPLVTSFLPLWHNYLVYIFALCFLAWCGSFLHAIFRR